MHFTMRWSSNRVLLLASVGAIFILNVPFAMESFAADPAASAICIQNGGGFHMKAGYQCGSGTSGITFFSDNYFNPDTKCARVIGQPPGAVCWAVADIRLGETNKKSAENFIFQPWAGAVDYTITGTTFTSRFSRGACVEV